MKPTPAPTKPCATAVLKKLEMAASCFWTCVKPQQEIRGQVEIPFSHPPVETTKAPSQPEREMLSAIQDDGAQKKVL